MMFLLAGGIVGKGRLFHRSIPLRCADYFAGARSDAGRRF
jgi:hypothetical protein